MTKSLSTIGRILFALPFGILGLNHFFMYNYYVGMVSSFIPGGGFTVIITGIALIAACTAIILEKFRIYKPIHWIHTISLPFMIVGVLLSTLHQSSFGSLYLIVPNRLHPLWYSPLLPVLFFVSCLSLALVATWSRWGRGRRDPEEPTDHASSWGTV